MNVYSLYQQLSGDLPFALDKIISGSGADGEVWSLKSDVDKVLKLSIIYDHPSRRITKYSSIHQVLNYVMMNCPSAYVRVYEHNFLGEYSRQVPFRKEPQKLVIYHYVMQRLFPLTEDEQKVFHSILSHEDRGIKKDLSFCKIEKVLFGLSRGLDFDAERIKLFITALIESPLAHADLHQRNILKDNEGNYRLIDLDRVDFTDRRNK